MNTKIKNLTLSSMFLALAYILPFFTGQVPQIGSMLCPMHIPVILCGFFVGGEWAFMVGLIAPILRSVILTAPKMFPTAICMAFELATYGLAAGYLYRKLPKNKVNVYVSLLSAMVIGRIVWGIAMYIAMSFNATTFTLDAFLAGALLNAIPGILIQLILIPILVIKLNKKA